MTSDAVATLVLIAIAAVLAPIVSELTGRLAIPEIVIQIGFGIILGPYVLGVAHINDLVTGLSDLGLTFLIFLAGYELDLKKIRGRPLQLATAGWGISLIIGDWPATPWWWAWPSPPPPSARWSPCSGTPS
jgi:Kef-type K+ transport system membrane component KefB